MNVTRFTFLPRWKEELVCSSPLGSLVLEMPMGVESVYLPTEAAWRDRAPGWAREHWQEIHTQLQEWCTRNKIPLYVEDTAQVYQA
jgi:hypothetical protein